LTLSRNSLSFAGRQRVGTIKENSCRDGEFMA
jgi:hypothetical protein